MFEVIRWATLVLLWVCIILQWCSMYQLREARRKTDDLMYKLRKEVGRLREMPDVVPCYECRFYLEDEPFCPKSGMKMKDGLIFCCYGERKEDGSDEGNNND